MHYKNMNPRKRLILTLTSRSASGLFTERPSLSLLQRSNLSGETGNCNGLEKFTECKMHYLGHYYRKVLHKLPVGPNRKDLLHLSWTNENPSECHTAGTVGCLAKLHVGSSCRHNNCRSSYKLEPQASLKRLLIHFRS